MDGDHHFRPILWSNTEEASDPLAQAARDGSNARNALEAGVWVIRYYQPHLIGECGDWRTYRRACHTYVTEHAAERPRVLVPATSRTLYVEWAARARFAIVFL